MRLIDADELKEKLLKIQDNIVNEKVPRGNTKSDVWKPAYLLILDEYIKMLDEMPSATCGSNADDFLDAYGRGYSKGRVDALSMENSKMTREEIWDKIIQNLKTLDQEAHDEEFVPLVTGLLVMTAEELSTDVIHSTVKQDDKSHMWSLVDGLGCYSIKGQTIKYLPEYQELTTLIEKVF